MFTAAVVPADPRSLQSDKPMKPQDFVSDSAGRAVKTLAGYWAFIPKPLPPDIPYDATLTFHLSQADARFASGDYAASLKALAALRGPVDAFFDRVMVNAEDPALRANRLALLSGLHAAMNRVADLSKLAA